MDYRANTTSYDSGSQMEANFPGLKVDNKSIGCFDREAGIVRADKALNATLVEVTNHTKINIVNNKLMFRQAMAQSYGCTLVDDFPVTDIEPHASDNTATVKGPRGSYTCKSVILCCGPWTNKLLEPLG